MIRVHVVRERNINNAVESSIYRESFATITLRNICEIKDIAEVLGHKRDRDY